MFGSSCIRYHLPQASRDRGHPAADTRTCGEHACPPVRNRGSAKHQFSASHIELELDRLIVWHSWALAHRTSVERGTPKGSPKPHFPVSHMNLIVWRGTTVVSVPSPCNLQQNPKRQTGADTCLRTADIKSCSGSRCLFFFSHKLFQK